MGLLLKIVECLTNLHGWNNIPIKALNIFVVFLPVYRMDNILKILQNFIIRDNLLNMFELLQSIVYMQTIKFSLVSERGHNVVVELLVRCDKYLRSFEAFKHSFDELDSFAVKVWGHL
jgi:hypothetical protein